MEERDLGDPEPEIILKSWQDHEWTAEEIRFVSKMLQHGNKSRAARETFPEQANTPQSQFQTAMRMLARPHIAEYLTAVRAEMAASMELTRENILNEVMLLAKSNMSDFLIVEEDGRTTADFSGLTREQFAAIQEVEIHTYIGAKGTEDEGRPVKAIKFKLAPKLPALQLAGSHLKLWTDVVETNTSLVEQAALMRTRRLERRSKRDDEPSQD